MLIPTMDNTLAHIPGTNPNVIQIGLEKLISAAATAAKKMFPIKNKHNAYKSQIPINDAI